MSEEQYAKRLSSLRKKARSAQGAGGFLKKASAGTPITAPLRAFSLASKMRRKALEGKQAPWLIAFAFAITCDGLGLIPIAGWVVSLFLRPCLFFFLWGRGTWKIRLLCYGLILFDFVPIVEIFPLSTISVTFAYLKSEKQHLSAKEGLKTSLQET